jgi:hypothetical protein
MDLRNIDVTQIAATGTPSSSTYLRGDNVWASLTIGGMIAIHPHDNGVPVYYATVDLAFAASTPGDMIVVESGTYSTTITAANGLLKDGISWNFLPGSILTKSTSGPLFRNNAFTSSTNVYGYGKFQTSNVATNVYLIDGARQNVDTVFECARAVTTNSYDAIATNCTIGSFTGVNTTRIKAQYVASGTGLGIGFYGYGLLYDIELGVVNNPSNVGIYINAQETKGKVRYIMVKSGSSHAIQATNGSYNSRVAFEGVNTIPGGAGYSYALQGNSYNNISYYSISAPSGMNDTIASGDKIMSLYAGTGVSVNSSVLWNFATIDNSGVGNVTGSVINLTLSSGYFYGLVTGLLTQSGGRFEGTIGYNGRGDFSGATITGGVSIIREFSTVYNSLTVNGGDVTLHNYYSGGNNWGAGYHSAAVLQSGTLRITGPVRNINTTNAGGIYPCLKWTGGTLILHSSASFYCGSTDSAAIQATGSMTGKIYGNVVSNTADTGTITWQVGTVANRIVDANVR